MHTYYAFLALDLARRARRRGRRPAARRARPPRRGATGPRPSGGRPARPGGRPGRRCGAAGRVSLDDALSASCPAGPLPHAAGDGTR